MAEIKGHQTLKAFRYDVGPAQSGGIGGYECIQYVGVQARACTGFSQSAAKGWLVTRIKRRGVFVCFRIAWMLAVSALFLSAAFPVYAGKGDFLVSKRFYGIVALGAGSYFLKEAYDARKDANENYDAYKLAASPETAEYLYDRSKRNDTRSAVLLGLGLSSLAMSIHFFLSTDEDDLLPPPRMKRGLVEVKGVALDVGGDPWTMRMDVKLLKGF